MSQRQNANNTETILEIICLENNHMYHFSIYDSFGDGICCLEGKGAYIVSINDIIVKQGGEFGTSENFLFSPQECNNDLGCDDDDIATIDECNIDASACLHFRRPCHEYGESVKITIETHSSPLTDTWKIVDETGVVQTEGGPYGQAHSIYTSEGCLINGNYILNYTGNFQMDVSIEQNGKIIVDETMHFMGTQEKNFEVNVSGTPLDEPTLSPSNFPSYSQLASSDTPSIRPSLKPSELFSDSPSLIPSNSPSSIPSNDITISPSLVSSTYPSILPSISPSLLQSTNPSSLPSVNPSFDPSICNLSKRKACAKEINSCYWDKVTKKCYGKDETPSCSFVTSWWKCNKLKQSNFNCLWSKKTCHELICSDYNNRWNKCNKHANCNWDSITKECLGKNEIPSCDAVTLKWKCNKLNKIYPKCEWSTLSKACETKA